jgi:photosystem II stability/assembly factor-like uncharacterized protein
MTLALATAAGTWIGTGAPSTAAPPAAQVRASGPAYTWRNVRVGGGGFIPGIVFSRVEKGLAYLRSDMGGAYRWDAAAKEWIPLQDGQPESSYQGTESIAPDPVDANVVYVAAGMYRIDQAAILRSRDRGAHWDAFKVTFRMGGNEDGRGLGERLAIDPNDTSILYFGSRHDGLQRSANHGETWAKVASFPVRGLGTPAERSPTHAGIAFVVFDPHSGAPGQKSKTIFAGSADPGPHHLFRSDDAGETWAPVPNEPRATLLPVKAELDDAGTLYVTYCNGMGPNGVTDGAVFKLDTRTGAWTDISPEQGAKKSKGGYMGLSLDRQRAGTLAVTTMNRWAPGDTVWRSADGGATWADIRTTSTRDVTDTPFLKWGEPEAKLGWWMAALAIDPFNSDFAAYATGATIYATQDFTHVDGKATTTWTPWTQGIEQTAIITLTSPPVGPHLLSGFGDISGFAHDDLAASPTKMYTHPVFGNTNNIDYAGAKPNLVVRSGTPHGPDGATLALSEDAGETWRPLKAPPLPDRAGRRAGEGAIAISAGGTTLIVNRRAQILSRNGGAAWIPVHGLPPNARAVADRVDDQRFYAVDYATSRVLCSSDGGEHFADLPTSGLPADLSADEPTWHEAPWPLHATPGHAGELWLFASEHLYRSRDGGATFSKIASDLRFQAIAFGKPPNNSNYPTLFSIAGESWIASIWRSDDAGAHWVRVNDDAHQYGTRLRCIEGDPRVFGRVYVGTDGRGIVYGEPSTTP